MEGISTFKPICILLPNKPSNIKFKIRKKKGIVELKEIESNTYLKNYHENCQMAKNLPPTKELPYPYWNIYYMIEPFSMYDPDNIELNYFEDHTSEWSKNTFHVNSKFRQKLVSYNLITGILPFHSREIFNMIIPKNKKLNALFMFNSLNISPIEEYIIYRESSSNMSHLDKIIGIELPMFVSEDNQKTSEQTRTKFKKVFSIVDYSILEGNICDYEVLKKVIDTILIPLDYINISLLNYHHKSRRYLSHFTSQNMFNYLILCFSCLVKGGRLTINIGDINNQLIIDIIAILSYNFDNVYIFKSSVQNLIMPYKNIVCQGFKGHSHTLIDSMIDISKKWNKIHMTCNIDTDTIDKKHYYIHSILDYHGNDSSIEQFNTIEMIKRNNIWIQIINTYNDIQLYGDIIFEQLHYRQLSNSLLFLKMHNIPINMSLKSFYNINNKLNLRIDYDNSQFNWKFKAKPYKSNTTIYQLPDRFKSMKGLYNMEELYEKENQLKFTKRILDTFDTDRYKNISMITKPLNNLKPYVKKIVGLEVSQAFLKIYEIISLYDLFDKNNSELRSFHFCEAPGQFIRSIDRYIDKKTNIKRYNWIAQSLNPKFYKNAFGDTYGLMSAYPDRWDYGEDSTGDIMNVENIKYYQQLNKVHKPSFITSDCGESMENPTQSVYQDKVLAKLNYCQILLALSSLPEGGNYVSKVFLTQSVPYIVSLNYIMYCCFDKMYIHKSMINAGSSEVYLICKGYHKLSMSQLDSLFHLVDRIELDEKIVDIPDEFLEQYTEAMSFFIQQHISHIQKNIYFYENSTSLLEDVNILKIYNENSRKWIRYFGFR